MIDSTLLTLSKTLTIREQGARLMYLLAIDRMGSLLILIWASKDRLPLHKSSATTLAPASSTTFIILSFSMMLPQTNSRGISRVSRTSSFCFMTWLRYSWNFSGRTFTPFFNRENISYPDCPIYPLQYFCKNNCTFSLTALYLEILWLISSWWILSVK